MSDFMQMQITDKQFGWCAETTDGTFYYPLRTLSRRQIRNEWGDRLQSIIGVEGYFGRYSAPGYLDATDWSFDTNRRRLAETLREMYGD